ncbi:hypothetical protein QQG74_03130 [Micromonospora sp. FIMYZ51]|uniref:hypothetical protein n=1 Tax=Micromonospora sp. FIMYZ51 TaxID=3051832 RepID=UPI00311E11C7
MTYPSFEVSNIRGWLLFDEDSPDLTAGLFRDVQDLPWITKIGTCQSQRPFGLIAGSSGLHLSIYGRLQQVVDHTSTLSSLVEQLLCLVEEARGALVVVVLIKEGFGTAAKQVDLVHVD